MPRISDAVRERLWVKQAGRCGICTEPMTRVITDPDALLKGVGRTVAMTPRYWSIDHIVPVSKGGSDDESNLQLACGSCNRKKGVR